MRSLALCAALAIVARGEILDRIAVTVGSRVIARSEVEAQTRIASLLDARPLSLTAGSLRQAADRLVEQTLVRREMELAGYPAVPEDAILATWERWKQDRTNAGGWRELLLQYGVTEAQVRRQLQWQVTLLRFVEFRFRPGVQIQEEDIVEYYRDRFRLQWERDNPGKPVPLLAQVHQQIEEQLTQTQIDSLLDRWLNTTRGQLAIQYRDQALGVGKDNP